MDIAKAIIELLVGLVVFIVGMNMMSNGLKNSAGKNIRGMLKKIRDNRFAGIGIGAVVTGIIQSSSANSVMVIGLKEMTFISALADSIIIMEFVTRLVLSYTTLPLIEYINSYYSLGIGICMLLTSLLMFIRFIRYKA